MRIWSIHPKYLDTKGLVALWRESLLAKKVLAGNTKGYVNHPQLERFKEMNDPIAAIDYYLSIIYEESIQRGYKFDRMKFNANVLKTEIKVTTEQINFERNHLLAKLKNRDFPKYLEVSKENSMFLHPLFSEIEGGIASWEKIE